MATLLAWPYPWDRVRQALNQPQGNWVCPKVLRQGQLREPSRTPIKPHIIPVLGLTRSCLGGFSSIPISHLGLFGGVLSTELNVLTTTPNARVTRRWNISIHSLICHTIAHNGQITPYT